MSDDGGGSHRNGHHVASFWIALIRGVLIIGLGLSLILIPEKTQAVLFNMMGVFEIVLGTLFLLSPTGKGQDIYIVGTIWALFGGGLILGTALFQGVQTGRQGAAETAPDTGQQGQPPSPSP